MSNYTQGQRKILVADNDRALLKIIKRYLELCHYHVTTADTGLDALRLLRSGNYHVLVTDIIMPDISGLGLIAIGREEFPKLPIIAITGYGRQVKDLTAETAPDYALEKPFNLKELSSVIDSVLSY